MFIIRTIRTGEVLDCAVVDHEAAVAGHLLTLEEKGYRPLFIVNADSGRVIDACDFAVMPQREVRAKASRARQGDCPPPRSCSVEIADERSAQSVPARTAA
jgi:hypothetical protein